MCGTGAAMPPRRARGLAARLARQRVTAVVCSASAHGVRECADALPPVVCLRRADVTTKQSPPADDAPTGHVATCRSPRTRHTAPRSRTVAPCPGRGSSGTRRPCIAPRSSARPRSGRGGVGRTTVGRRTVGTATVGRTTVGTVGDAALGQLRLGQLRSGRQLSA